MRLDKFLADTTDLTRSLAKKALHREEVSVDGQVTKNPATQVDADSEVRWLGQPLVLVGMRYVMLNKPAGVECSARRGLYPLVRELIALPNVERLQTVGRLDVDTTGLVLLSDDGQWSHRVTSPKRRCGKVYRVGLSEPLEGEALVEAQRRFADGVMLDAEDKPTRPAELDMRGPREAELTLYEGKYHQVKRMFAAIGNHVETLHRESVGPLTLGELAPGEWRELTRDEVAAF
ncbi:ribosomal small subunit pseudouridine synthase A [Franzmannia pantelleriensis]|uniref:Pseudouridine synthase n=1 Tax=Franzmannia pantelleriensis TaxID=48727 RepID=A0A1G9FFT1_9GAMM|nr:pseudouridine synthase [Halomonas pantelleriensis]SDK87206.1 ribosomal small subunit pseudouridine synthase A [Halomonas pantelleriensis]